MKPSAVSYRDVSTTAPWPVRSRSSSAERIPSAAHMPVPMSMSEEPTRTPGRPGSPVMLMSPPAACMSASYPGSSESGPTWPYAPIEQ